jgi:hypothetical protein
MTISNRRRNSNLGAVLCIAAQLLIFSTWGVGQDSCPGIPPPDTNLYLIPDRMLYSYDFTTNGLVVIHDYGKTRLAYLSDAAGAPPEILSQITEISNLSSIAFRTFSRQFSTPSSVNGELGQSSVYLAAMFGPLDSRILDLLRTSGILILDSAPPYGLLIKSDASAMDKALHLCTSEGYRLIRNVFPLPIEARLNPILLKMATLGNRGQIFIIEYFGHQQGGQLVIGLNAFPIFQRAKSAGVLFPAAA